MAIRFKGAHFPPEVMLMGVRWYVAYPPEHAPCRRTPCDMKSLQSLLCAAKWVTQPAVPSAVSYGEVREGNDLYRASGPCTPSQGLASPP
jgi:hypothetical protein